MKLINNEHFDDVKWIYDTNDDYIAILHKRKGV